MNAPVLFQRPTPDQCSEAGSAAAGVPQPAGASLLLQHYGVLEWASAEMLHAARHCDWDRMCRLEGACVVVIARLESLAAETPLAPFEQGERMRILLAILANDAEVRRICQPWPALLDPPDEKEALGPQAERLH